MVKHAVGTYEKGLGSGVCERCEITSRVPERGIDTIVLDDLRLPDEFQSSLRLEDEEVSRYITRAVLYEKSLVSRRPLNEVGVVLSPETQESIGLCHRLMRLVEVVFLENRPKRVFYYNDVYAVNRVVKLVADQLGIETVNLHLSLIPARMWDHFVATDSREALLAEQKAPRYAPVVTRPSSRKISQAFRFQEFGKSPFVYSARGKRTLRRNRRSNRRVPIGERQQVLLALSSHDEMDALKVLLPKELAEASYEQQNTLMWFLEVASLYPDLDFVIRPHPREFPNRRHEGMTPSAERFLDITRSTPPNVRIDLPESVTPLFSLVRSSQAVIFTWSSIGLEALIIGKHTATTTPKELTWCPSGLFPHIQSKEDMIKFITLAISTREEPRGRLDALRWYASFLSAMDNSFSTIPYRLSPARWVHGLVGRGSTGGWRRLLPLVRQVEISASRQIPLDFPHRWSSDEADPSPISPSESRLLKKLASRHSQRFTD